MWIKYFPQNICIPTPGLSTILESFECDKIYHNFYYSKGELKNVALSTTVLELFIAVYYWHMDTTDEAYALE